MMGGPCAIAGSAAAKQSEAMRAERHISKTSIVLRRIQILLNFVPRSCVRFCLAMPELPEVETVRRGLAERVVGERIASVWLGDKPEPFKSPRQEIERVLVGARISAVRRMGKHIVVDLDPGASSQRRATN